MFREIDPNKLLKKRGTRSRREVAAAAGFKVTEQDIYCYEKGLHKPSTKKLPYLLKGLDTTFEEVSEPVELSLA